MATNPARHPFDDEIEEMLADREFVEKTREVIAARRRGDVPTYEHADVVREMRRRAHYVPPAEARKIKSLRARRRRTR